jgi:hypothetical protein
LYQIHGFLRYNGASAHKPEINAISGFERLCINNRSAVPMNMRINTEIAIGGISIILMGEFPLFYSDDINKGW